MESLRDTRAGADAANTPHAFPRQRFSSNRISCTRVRPSQHRGFNKVDCGRQKELLRIATDRGLAGERGRISGAAHRGVLEFLFKAEYAYDMGMPQRVARIDHALSAFHLERLFLGRHKVFHFRVWYRDALAGYVREMLLDPRSLARPYIERKHLEQMVGVTLRAIRTTPTRSTKY